MISIHNTLVSDDLKEVFFYCDVQKCKGDCCVEGDAGAPLEEEEISMIENHRDEITPFMRDAGKTEIEKNGVFDYDADGRFVTPLIKGRECVYVYFENDIARCAIEKAFSEGKISFPKPLSCHLYPVRLTKLYNGEAVNYHKWQICDPALENGQRRKVLLYRFLEEALIRKYGHDWYNNLNGI